MSSLGHALKVMFFGETPVVIAEDLRRNPLDWRPSTERNPLLLRAYRLERRGSALNVWIASSWWGVTVYSRGAALWGGVTVLSTFGLSPGHWLLWSAVRFALKAQAAEALAGALGREGRA